MKICIIARFIHKIPVDWRYDHETIHCIRGGAVKELLTGLIALEPKAEAAGSAPVAANLEMVTTYRGVSVGGQLAAYDPDGGELTFEITTPPVKGTIELSDGGSFIYDSRRGKEGARLFRV